MRVMRAKNEKNFVAGSFTDYIGGHKLAKEKGGSGCKPNEEIAKHPLTDAPRRFLRESIH